MKEVKTGALSIFFLAIIFIFPAISAAGDLDPSGAPLPTMKTLDEIPPSWHQTLSDSERFESVMGDTALLDKETGLVWTRNANLASGTDHWQEAINYCRDLEIGSRKGWRLPRIEELSSLIDMSKSGSPKVYSGFNNVHTYYWSNTDLESDSGRAYLVSMQDGAVIDGSKTGGSGYIWAVRGGK